MQHLKLALLSVVGCATMATFSACNNNSKDTAASTSTTDNGSKMTTEVTKSASVKDDSLFVKDDSGLDCKFVTHGTGTVTPKPGDIAELVFVFRMGDSVMINTDVQNNHKPVPQEIAAPQLKGDLSGGLMKLKVGDSAVFRILADTLFARVGRPKAPWLKPGDYIVWEVKMVNLIDKSQAAAENKKKFDETLAEIAKQSKAQNDMDDKLLQAYFKSHNVKNAKKTPSGIYYTVAKPGSGAHAEFGQNVVVNYTGQNLKGQKFDSNEDPAFGHKAPFDFVVGQRVIPGWSIALPYMNKGMKATFYIPSSLAYGPQGQGDKIGPNEVLIFDIELTDLK